MCVTSQKRMCQRTEQRNYGCVCGVVCVYIYIYIYIYCVCFVCVSGCVRACVSACVRACVCVRVFIYVHLHTITTFLEYIQPPCRSNTVVRLFVHTYPQLFQVMCLCTYLSTTTESGIRATEVHKLYSLCCRSPERWGKWVVRRYVREYS